MAQLAVAAVGALALGPVGLGLTTAGTGFMLGSLAYSLMAPGQKSYGPRLNDLKVTGTEYGSAIPWVAGSPRVAGQIIWASRRRETATEQEQGKGGGPSVTSYTYDVDLLILISENPIFGISRVWSNGELVFSGGVAKTGAWMDMRVHTGDEDQLPDPTYEAGVGVGNAPAYRGMGTVLIQGLQLGNSGNIPNLTFELSEKPEYSQRILYQFSSANPQLDKSGNGFGINESVNSNFSPSGLLLSAAQSPYSYVRHNSSSELFVSGDFTLEFFWRGTVFPQTKNYPVILEMISPLGGGLIENILITYDEPSSRGRYKLYAGSAIYISSIHDSHDFSHVCVMRRGADVGFFVNGVRDSGLVQGIAVNFQAGSTFTFGNQTNTSGTASSDRQLDGVIDSFRLSDVAMYEMAGFVAPSMPLKLMPPPGGDIHSETLSHVLELLMSRCGYGPADYVLDAALVAQAVHALAVGQVSSTRSVLEVMVQAFFLEVSADEQIRFRRRSVTPVAAIPFADLGMSSNTGGEDEPFAITLGNDLELPAQLALSYPNVVGNYQVATEFSDRLMSGQKSTETIQVPLGLKPSEAKVIVDGLLMDRVASLATATIKLPLKYARLEPGDVITVTDRDGRAYRLRIVTKKDALPILEFQCVLDDVGAIDSAAITDDGYIDNSTVIQPAGTALQALDIPILRDADDAPGYYVTVAPVRVAQTDKWPGALIAQSWNGTDYEQLLTTTAEAVMGTASTVLGGWSGGAVFDEMNTVTVAVSGELASSTREAMLLDEAINAVLIGGEIVRFRLAALVSTGVYLLSGLLRGQRGTEWAMGTHSVGERVVLLGGALRRVHSQTSELGLERQLKGVTLGGFLSSGVPQGFVDTGVALKPFSPANPRALADGADLVVTWQRRTRHSYQYGGASPVVPVGEAVEAYRVRVLSGATLLRSDTVTTPLYRYSADMQSTDGVASGVALTFEICQLSAITGPGYPSTVGATAP